MTELAPLCVAVPLVGAAVLSGLTSVLPRLLGNLLTAACIVTVVVLTGRLVGETSSGRVVTWVGGWTPAHGTSVGIALVVDRAGAGMALLAAVMALVALIFSWHYLGGSEALAHALVLLFLAGACGLALTGDLFDMFVFFELMSVAAYALTAWKSEDPQSEQGGFTFGITNSLGAYVTLVGIGLVYARTGELNLALVRRQLLAHPAQASFVAAAFALVVTGFLVKSALAPFHFWIADAHAVAPTPVCVLFSGVMVELGLYGVVRIYFAAFDGVLPQRAFEHLLLGLGVLTAVVGTVMSMLQVSVKRLLAFSTMAHLGLLAVGCAVLDDDALAGAAGYLLSHSAVKAALFICAGVLLNRFRSVDQRVLHGRGRQMPVTSVLFLVGGLALADLPPFGTAAGKGVLEDAAEHAGHHWPVVLFLFVSAGTGGAVLAAWARVFRGWGSHEPVPEGQQTTLPEEEPDSDHPVGRVPLSMAVPATLLLVAGVLLGVLPHVGSILSRVGAQLHDTAGYSQATLALAHVSAPRPPAVPLWTGGGLALDAATVVAACLLAVLLVRRPHRAGVAAGRVVEPLRRLHSGHIGDYVAWLAVGVAVSYALLRSG